MLRISKGLVDMPAIGWIEHPSAWGSGGPTLLVEVDFPLFPLLCLVGPNFWT